MRSNYEALLMMGCFPEKPNFMKSAKEKKRMEKKLEKEDEEKKMMMRNGCQVIKRKKPSTAYKTKVSVKKTNSEVSETNVGLIDSVCDKNFT